MNRQEKCSNTAKKHVRMLNRKLAPCLASCIASAITPGIVRPTDSSLIIQELRSVFVLEMAWGLPSISGSHAVDGIVSTRGFST